jgi:hypothetical protein
MADDVLKAKAPVKDKKEAAAEPAPADGVLKAKALVKDKKEAAAEPAPADDVLKAKAPVKDGPNPFQVRGWSEAKAMLRRGYYLFICESEYSVSPPQHLPGLKITCGEKVGHIHLELKGATVSLQSAYLFNIQLPLLHWKTDTSVQPTRLGEKMKGELLFHIYPLPCGGALHTCRWSAAVPSALSCQRQIAAWRQASLKRTPGSPLTGTGSSAARSWLIPVPQGPQM